MDYFNLSFISRLGLALLSGLLPTLLLFDAANYFADLLFAPYAIALALLVLLPFIRPKSHRLARSMILVAAAITNLAFAYWLVDPLNSWFSGSLVVDLSFLAMFLPILLSTVIISVVTAIIASIKITARFIAIACVAGSVAGLVVPYLLLEAVCWFDCTRWDDLPFAGGWVVWHTAIFLAINSGKV